MGEKEDHTECWDSSKSKEFPKCDTSVVGCISVNVGHWWWSSKFDIDIGLVKGGKKLKEEKTNTFDVNENVIDFFVANGAGIKDLEIEQKIPMTAKVDL